MNRSCHGFLNPEGVPLCLPLAQASGTEGSHRFVSPRMGATDRFRACAVCRRPLPPPFGGSKDSLIRTNPLAHASGKQSFTPSGLMHSTKVAVLLAETDHGSMQPLPQPS